MDVLRKYKVIWQSLLTALAIFVLAFGIMYFVRGGGKDTAKSPPPLPAQPQEPGVGDDGDDGDTDDVTEDDDDDLADSGFGV